MLYGPKISNQHQRPCLLDAGSQALSTLYCTVSNKEKFIRRVAFLSFSVVLSLFDWFVTLQRVSKDPLSLRYPKQRSHFRTLTISPLKPVCSGIETFSARVLPWASSDSHQGSIGSPSHFHGWTISIRNECHFIRSNGHKLPLWRTGSSYDQSVQVWLSEIGWQNLSGSRDIYCITSFSSFSPFHSCFNSVVMQE